LVRLLFLAALLLSALSAWAWELVVAFTNDLHVAMEGLPALEPYLRGADLILDAGDTWEDLYRFTDISPAEEITRWMEGVGYAAKVLGNHGAYLGPALQELLPRVGFPVLGTNVRGIPGIAPWTVVERKGLRILILGFVGPKRDVYFPYPLWPKAEVMDPVAAARWALEVAPEHDLLIIVAHMGLEDAVSLARAVPGCDLLVLGHDHLFLEEPAWAAGVPIVEAGHRAQAVGIATLGPEGLVDYELIRMEKKPTKGRSALLPVVALALLFLLFSAGK